MGIPDRQEKANAPLSSVEEVYGQVREMAANFEFKPEERLNESALSKRLGTSRTPLREALNRLVTEGLLVSVQGRGFFCRSLNPDKIIELYELRESLETHAIRLAIDRASDQGFSDIKEFLMSVAPLYSSSSTARKIVAFDEEFHLRLARLSKNSEIVAALENLHERIRYVRWISMRKKIDVTHEEHLNLLNIVASRDIDQATRQISNHVRTSNAEATETVREAYSQMFVPVNEL